MGGNRAGLCNKSTADSFPSFPADSFSILMLARYSLLEWCLIVRPRFSVNLWSQHLRYADKRDAGVSSPDLGLRAPLTKAKDD